MSLGAQMSAQTWVHTSLVAQKNAHTSFGAYTSTHTSTHMSLGTHASTHSSLEVHTSAHTSARICVFCPRLLYGCNSAVLQNCYYLKKQISNNIPEKKREPISATYCQNYCGQVIFPTIFICILLFGHPL